MPEGTYQVMQDVTNLVLCIYQEITRLQAAWLADQSFDEFRVALPAYIALRPHPQYDLNQARTLSECIDLVSDGLRRLDRVLYFFCGRFLAD